MSDVGKISECSPSQMSSPLADDAGAEVIRVPQASSWPDFRPALGLKNAHAQTLYGVIRPGRSRISGTVRRELPFADGDVVVMHDDTPKSWSPGGPVVLLLHGLAGCHNSGYMVRLTAKLMQRNVRVFRMDHRGCGAGRMLAKHPYHAGRIRDLEAAVRMLERICPASPISLVGFSLSGNLVLRYLGDDPTTLPLRLHRAVAICPPIDLVHCAGELAKSRLGQQYDWYFARQLIGQIAETPLWRDDLPIAREKRLPRRIIEFDESYTAPAAGFENAEHYYAYASAAPHLSKIQRPTLVLAAEDDPLVSSKTWQTADVSSSCVQLRLTAHGGHLGFIGRSGPDPDCRWMDWRIVDWLTQPA